MRPVKGRDGVLDADRIKRWLGGAPPYSVEYRIVFDNAEALQGDLTRLKKTAKTLSFGYAFLVCSWVSFALVTHFAK